METELLIYAFIWRNAGLTADAKTIDDLIAAYQGAADSLRLLQEVGAKMDPQLSTGDDACLCTGDLAVAEKYGFTVEASTEQKARIRMRDAANAAEQTLADAKREAQQRKAADAKEGTV